MPHDFIARVVARFLGQARQDRLRQLAAYAVAALLVVVLAAGADTVASERAADDRAVRALAALGLSVGPEDAALGTLRVEAMPELTDEGLQEAEAPLRRLAAQIHTVQLRGANLTNIAALAGLTRLQSLNLSATEVSDAAPLAGLTALQSLSLFATRVSDVAPLAGLAGLQSLDLCAGGRGPNRRTPPSARRGARRQGRHRHARRVARPLRRPGEATEAGRGGSGGAEGADHRPPRGAQVLA